MGSLKRYVYKGIFVISVMSIPGVVFAAPANFKAFALQIVNLINMATALLFALGIAFFFYRIVQGMMSASGGDAGKKKDLRETLTWGIIIIFVMVSIWGIIAILQRTLMNGL